MTARSGPVGRRLSGYSLRLSRLVRAAASRAVNENRVVYCGDHVVLTRIKNGSRIYLDMRDASVAVGIALGVDYEPHVARVLRDVTREGDVFFDVGANVGYHTLLVWDVLSGGRGEMHLFEPNHSVRALLQRTMHANAMWKGVHLASVALSDRDGHATLTIYEDLWGGARLQDPEDLGVSENPWAEAATVREQFDVPTMTLDQYCSEAGVERIDVMKIDVEGHEAEVFAGMSEMLDKSPTLKVVMEFTFGAYRDAPGFWSQLSDWFPYRYLIEPSGALTAITSFDDLRSRAKHELQDVLLTRVGPVE